MLKTILGIFNGAGPEPSLNTNPWKKLANLGILEKDSSETFRCAAVW